MARKLQDRLDEAEETLRALRSGEVDAIVASGLDGDRVYTLYGADEAYRLMIQNMGEGALTVTPEGLILFANERLASLLAIPNDRIIGSSFYDFVVPEDANKFSALIALNLPAGTKGEVWLKAFSGVPVPVSLSVNHLELQGVDCYCIIVADLSDQKRSETALRKLSARLLQVQDEDRRRIARGLHDGAFQRLAALEFKLTLIDHASARLPSAARQNLHKCLDLVGECCKDLSNLAYLIQPPLLDERGLGPAFRAYVNGFNERRGPQVSLHFPRRLGRLPAELETALFRIAQEALANVEQHSGSTAAEILLRNEHGKLLLEITDHGCGMSKEILTQVTRGTMWLGLGIAGMRERVHLLGGVLEICSSSEGTTVRAKIPIKRPPPNSMVKSPVAVHIRACLRCTPS